MENDKIIQIKLRNRKITCALAIFEKIISKVYQIPIFLRSKPVNRASKTLADPDSKTLI